MMPGGTWAQESAVIEPGSRVYIFSDGAFEITTADGGNWSLETLRAIVGAGGSAREAEAQRLYQAVRAAARPGPSLPSPGRAYVWTGSRSVSGASASSMPCSILRSTATTWVAELGFRRSGAMG